MFFIFNVITNICKIITILAGGGMPDMNAAAAEESDSDDENLPDLEETAA